MTLLIMAAGMGSRYGGIKQIEPVGKHGELIIDYSIFDAIKAGFDKVVFIIRRDIEQEFKKSIFDRIGKHIKAEYVFQEKPQGERTKPWGTTHAILAAKNVVKEPFCVINADDFYGREALVKMAEYLKQNKSSIGKYAIVGYQVGNTMSGSGSVTRGVCVVDKNKMLTKIDERKRIEKHGDRIAFTLDDGTTWHQLAPNQTVSMNFWGFTPDLFPKLEQKFAEFFEANKNSMTAEYPIPVTIDDLMKENKVTVEVLTSTDKWLGITYQEDKKQVVDEFAKFIKDGVYPSPLWK